MTIRKIGVLTKPEQSEVAGVASELIVWCQDHDIDVVLPMEDRVQWDSEQLGSFGDTPASSLDLVVVIGGDGTLLAAARLLQGHPVPILAINHGGLGFLTEVTLPELYPQLEKVFAGEFVTDRRMMVDVRLFRGSKLVNAQRALNDVVINKGTLARIIELETHVDGQHVSTFRADGLILATPTGSTAYNLSAGGPIVHPDMSAMLVTPICSHTLTNRPLMLPGEAKVTVSLKSASDEGVYMTVDGQIGLAMEFEDRLEIQRSVEEVLLVAPEGKNYFDVLRDKLKWG